MTMNKNDKPPKKREVKFSLAVYGMAGLALAIAMLIGVALGTWIDNEAGTGYLWRSILILGGIILTSIGAWYWIGREKLHLPER